MRKHKRPPIKQTRVRKGKPYAPGLDLHARAQQIQPLDLSAPLPPQPHIPTTLGGEPTYILRASNPFSGMVLRFMANAAFALSIPLEEARKIRETALAMDLWRERNSGGG